MDFQVVQPLNSVKLFEVCLLSIINYPCSDYQMFVNVVKPVTFDQKYPSSCIIRIIPLNELLYTCSILYYPLLMAFME